MIARLTLATLALALFLDGSAHADPRLGDAAPALSLETLDGKPTRLPAGSIVIVDFFATWCGPCHEAVAALDAIARAHAAEVRLVVVDVGEEPAPIRQFLADHPLPPGAVLVRDPDGATAKRWGQHRFPTTFLVDGRGIIRHINRGYGSGYAERLEKWVAAMIVAAAR